MALDIVHTIVHNIAKIYNDADFEWDDNKSSRNLEQRDLSFQQALTIWLRPDDLLIRQDPRPYFDQTTGEKEIRFIALGCLANNRLLVVVFTHRYPEGIHKIRIISARKANKRERKNYEKARKQKR